MAARSHVVGGDAHELRTLDQKRGMPRIGDPRFIGRKRRRLIGRRDRRQPIRSNETGAKFRISGLPPGAGAGGVASCAQAATQAKPINPAAKIDSRDATDMTGP